MNAKKDVSAGLNSCEQSVHSWDPVTYPVDANSPFEPATTLCRIRRFYGGICRMAYPDQHEGWLVTDASMAKRILTDRRFSARAELKRSPVSRPGAEPFIGEPALPGWFVDMDGDEHLRLRRAVSGYFSPGYIKTLRPFITAVAEAALDRFQSMPQPACLMTHFALAVPARIICEILGVPYAFHDRFQEATGRLFSLHSLPDEAREAMDTLERIIADVIAVNRAVSASGLIGQLVERKVLTDREIIGASVLLLTAGHETVASMLGLSVFYLLSENPAAKTLLERDDRSRDLVDELLRYFSVFHLGVPRAALEDVTVGDVTIKKGEAVTLSLPALNRDPGWIDSPDVFDPSERSRRHLAFGHGMHQCIGQHLARAELGITLKVLFQKLPHLSLAKSPDDIILRQAGIRGISTLLVKW